MKNMHRILLFFELRNLPLKTQLGSWVGEKAIFLCWSSSGGHLFDPIYGLYFSHQNTYGWKVS